MKKLFTCLLALFMVLIMVPGAVLAAEVTASGTCGEVSWELTDGTLTVSGSGIMKNYDNYDTTPWEDMKDQIRNVVIEDGVTHIGAFSFAYCKNLETVSIGKDVQSIGGAAFVECKKLQNVELPEGLTQIGQMAFQECSRLQYVIIPDGVTLIGKNVFYNCQNLEAVYLPIQLQEIGSSAFDRCSKLTLAAYSGTMEQWDTVNVGGRNEPMKDTLWFVRDELMFHYQQSRDILMVSAVGAIPDFEQGKAPWNMVAGYTALVVLDETVTGLGENAFAGFKDLEYIYLGEGITSISDSAFSDSKKLTIHTPANSYAQKYAEEKGIASANDHDFAEMTVEVNCVDDGFTLYTCTQCMHMVFENYQPALGHDFQSDGAREATCTEDGYTGWVACTRCGLFESDGSFIPATGHSWGQWVETVKPDASNDGVNTRMCTACGETETEVIDNNIFSDVKKDRFEDAVLWAYYSGITTGTGDGTTFSPENACTRKQIVTFLWRAAGEPEPKSMENPFTDVKSDRFEEAILWAYYEGITTGTGDGSTFSPEATCTRKQIVTFLWRYNDEPAPESTEITFTDVKNDRFAPAILWAAEQGITTGTGDGSTFSPEDPCTRKQIVTFLFRDLA